MPNPEKIDKADKFYILIVATDISDINTKISMYFYALTTQTGEKFTPIEIT